MRYTTSDIKAIEKFADALKCTCEDIRDGMPKSRACENNGISLSMFNRIMYGLRRIRSDKNEQSSDSADDFYKPWQDRLIADLGAGSDAFIPDDFEDTLSYVFSVCLSDGESRTIMLYYKEAMPTERIATSLGVSIDTVRVYRKKALRKLKKHRDMLVHGIRYEQRIKQLSEMQQKYHQALEWIHEAIDYLNTIGHDEKTQISDIQISDEAKIFFKDNGFYKIADIIGVPLKDLFVRITDQADDDGVFLSISGDKGIKADTPLRNCGLKQGVLNVLEWNGIHTVQDLLSLSSGDIMSIPHIKADDIIKVYRLVLLGED